MKRTILLMAVCLCFIGKASAQWVVSDPGNLAQGIINTTKQIVQTYRQPTLSSLPPLEW
jgi:hypothetical protein